MRGFGITSPIPRHISIALGTPDLTPLEIAAGYAGIANGGRRVTPRFFDLVTDTERQRRRGSAQHAAGPAGDLARGRVRDRQPDEGRRRSAAPRSYASTLGRPDRRQDRHVARTTATSGSTASRPISLVGVWIGRDDSTPIGDKITGGGVGVPIWLDFMQKAHPRTKPIRDFRSPPERHASRASSRGAAIRRARRADAVWMPFVRGTLPQQFLLGPPVRSFDDLVPPPPVPTTPREVHASLSCLVSALC